MDYQKMTKEQLMSEADKRRIAYSSSWAKDRIMLMVIQDENIRWSRINNLNKETIINLSKDFSIAGAKLNIIFSIVVTLLMILLIILLAIGTVDSSNGPLFISILSITILFEVLTIYLNIKFLQMKGNRNIAGTMGVVFSCFIGGFLMFISKDIKEKKK